MPGLLPTRGSLMLDVVTIAMLFIVIAMVYSIFEVRKRKNYRRHKLVQITLSSILLIAILAFEVDLQLFTDWRELAQPSQFYESGWVDRALYIHLLFAIPTPLVWTYVVVQALRKFETPPTPNAHSSQHRIAGRVAGVMMFLTASTGWCFYLLAFVL